MPTLRSLAIAALGASALLAGCATPLVPPINGYLCCNIANSRGWIYASNALGGPFLPLGQPVSINEIKRTTYVYGTVGGDGYGFGQDSARAKEETLAWLKTLVVADDPTPRLNGYPAPVRTAILSARVFKGMTRDQVLMALGPPAPTARPETPAGTLRYWTVLDDTPVDLTFDAAGVLTQVTGSAGGLKLVEAPQ